MPILVFLGLSLLDLGPMYATDSSQTVRRQRDRRQTSEAETLSGLTTPLTIGGGALGEN